MSVFTTPILTTLLRWFANVTLMLIGWRVKTEAPKLEKMVLIGAPHTSNWDFPLMLLVILHLRMDVRWIGKHTLFKQPFNGLMTWLGGRPIERSQAHNTVSQMVDIIDKADQFTLLITPEGTRSKVVHWKTGFYHIAHSADIPIVLGYIDAARKVAGFGPVFIPTGDVESDLREIRKFYSDKHGIRSSLASDLD